MRVCILGSGLTALTLAKALVNQNVFVDVVSDGKNYKLRLWSRKRIIRFFDRTFYPIKIRIQTHLEW